METKNKIYSREEVFAETLKYFKGNVLAANVWIDKYSLKDKDRNIYELTPNDMHWRLANELARIENNYKNPIQANEIFELLKDFKYIVPQGSPMAGIGNDFIVTSISNCFVIDSPIDSYGGIFKADQEQVQLMKRRGGVGQDLSNIRPTGTLANGVVLKGDTGMTLYMNRYSNSTREVAQDSRRGALMLSTSIKHPDSEKFIDMKMDTSKVTGANVSVRIDDDFMGAVINKTNYLQQFPINSENPILTKEIDAAKLWGKIIHNAWKSAEPGILYWDKILRESPFKGYGKIWEEVSTNPCFTGNTNILTDKGYKTFKELEWSYNPLYKECDLPTFINENGDKAKGRVWSNGYKLVIKLVFDNLSFMECTPDHVFKLIDESECCASNLIGKIVKGFNGNHSKVTKIEISGIKEVFDFNLISDNHWGIVGGLVAHNCGEIPLCPYDSCRLVALNLYSYVENPFTSKALFNFELWNKHVQIAQRFMDDIVDLEIEKIDKILSKIESDPESTEIKSVELNLWKNIKQKAVDGRRTGLGITGEGDMLAALGLRYGTKEATDFSVEIHKQMAISAYTSSITLAEERGCFPIWNLGKDTKSDFLNRIYEILPEEQKYNWNLNGRRNGALLTIAPTGTTSILTQTTSGIEPCFLPYYTRRRKTDDKNKAVFIDEIGDMWEETFVFHHKFIEWYSKYNSECTSYEDSYSILLKMSKDNLDLLVLQSPYYKATSSDVDYFEKVKMQGAIQQWVDHSISVTVNMPNDATEAMVNEVYTTAWKNGCKGITIYRDGSRSGVLVSSDKTESSEEIVYRKAPSRPEYLNVDIYTKTALKKAWTVVIGLLKGKPYEIFAFEQLSNHDFPHEITKGKLKRVGKSIYQLIGYCNGKEYAIKNIIQLISQDESLQTKHYSRSLRYGEPIEEIVSDISLTANVTSFHKIVERTLKHYIKDGVTEDSCPNCGSKLFYESGCKICKNEECGWSACS